MQWILPVAGILICLVGMCLMMGAVGVLGRWRAKRGDEPTSASAEEAQP